MTKFRWHENLAVELWHCWSPADPSFSSAEAAKRKKAKGSGRGRGGGSEEDDSSGEEDDSDDEEVQLEDFEKRELLKASPLSFFPRYVLALFKLMQQADMVWGEREGGALRCITGLGQGLGAA